LSLPATFNLGFRFKGNCPAMAAFGHKPRFKALKQSTPLKIDVALLAASAQLRHYGTPYASDAALCAAKETMLWSGWVAKRRDGFLYLRGNTTGHSGELTNCSGSLGEALALHLAEDLYNIPLSLYRRIKEKDPQGMDFVAGTANGDLALEAKARANWNLSGAVDSATEQMKRRTAAQKYGSALLYQLGSKGKKRRRSYFYVFDPPPAPTGPSPEYPRRPLTQHYYQLAMVLGLWPLAHLMAIRLGIEPPTVEPEYLERALSDPERMAAVRVESRGRVHIGRIFDPRMYPLESLGLARYSSAWPYFFHGLDLEVIDRLIRFDDDDVAALVLPGPRYSERRSVGNDEISHARLSDGMLRVDLSAPILLDHGDLSL